MLQPFEACAECHDVGLAPPPCAIVVADVGAAVVRAARPVVAGRRADACHRGCEPVRMSCWFGLSPRPLTTSPFSVSEFSFDSLLLSLCRSATLAATCTPLALNHGPGADAVLRVHARLAVAPSC